MKLVENADEFEQEDPHQDNIIHLRAFSTIDVDADTILKEAIGKLDGVVVIGYLKGDRLNRSSIDEYFASSIAAGDTVVWLLERCKHKLLQIADDPWEPNDDPDTA